MYLTNAVTKVFKHLGNKQTKNIIVYGKDPIFLFYVTDFVYS